jgi:para-aminobenzoate synthetase component 1
MAATLEWEMETLDASCDGGELLERARGLPGVALLDSGGLGGTTVLGVFGTEVVSWPGPDDQPFTVLREHLARHTLPPHPHFPFTGGLIGWFGYDARRLLETLPERHDPRTALPGIHFRAYRSMVLLDEATGRLSSCTVVDPGDAGATRLAREQTRELEARLTDPVVLPQPPGPHCGVEDLIVPDPGAHRAAIIEAMDHIRRGDIYQVNLARCLEAPRPKDIVGFYRRLRRENPAAFGGFMEAAGEVLMSVSPERFLKVCGRSVVTRPIKGTAARHRDAAEDAHRARALLESEKDRAELAMIVDVLRNDLSRVCRAGSVRQRLGVVVESHPTVHHLVAEIEGELEPGRDALDLVLASLPGGSITGAPRIRAMEIIDALEPARRGPYCGALGYLGYDGRMDLNILIRSPFTAKDRLLVHGGGGIVVESNPDDEVAETEAKVRGILAALVG